MARAQSASLGAFGGRPDKRVDDELYSLRDENLILKKKLNQQDDRAKKLTTKVQRLSEDLLRNKEHGNGSPNDSLKLGRAKPIKGEFKNIEEAYDLIEDLRDQMKELTKENTITRNKMQYFRTLHEAETRRRTPYDHIPPRIQGQSTKKRLHQGLTVLAKPARHASAKSSRAGSPEMHSQNQPHVSQEEFEKLEEMNGMLRLKLTETDAEMERLKQELARSSEDRAALQLELSESRKRERDLSSRFDSLDERFRAMMEAHHEALRVSDELNADLKEERRRGVEMEHELKRVLSDGQENLELHEIIQDLREEKRLLEQEQLNLLSAQFGRDREEEYQNEIEELRENLRRHIQDLAKHLDEKKALHDENDSLKEHLREMQEDKRESDRHMFEIQQELDELREKMNFFCKNGEVDLSEIEEALSIVRLRRERGISLDFLMEAEELYADKELLQDLRVQYADCIHELEKVRKLLYLQEHINKDYKLEVEELSRKMEAMKNGYELRLEEDSRLLDLRSNKISHLEGQLKSIVYGTAKIPGEIEKARDEDDDVVELATGQNLVEIHIESALISDDGLYHVRKLGFDMEDPSKLTTFIHYDFFEFETQVSPMGLGQKPMFNCTSKYKVYTDDFFLQYLQSKNTVFHLAVSNGLESFNIATCAVMMKELTDPDRTDRLRYYADLISTHDGKAIIGKLDFGLRVRLPMAQAIRSFKERTVALNLLTVSDKEVTRRRFRPRADTNDLVLRIIQCKQLRQPPGRVPAVFASFQFYIHETIVTDTVRNSTSPMLNFFRILPLPMTSDLDRYLRTSSLTIMILDDNDGLEDFEYGSCTIPLLPLALGERIHDEYYLNDGFGAQKSKLTISLEWSKPYKLNLVPLISQLDDAVQSSGGRSHKAVNSQDDAESDTNDSSSRQEKAKSDKDSEAMEKLKTGGSSDGQHSKPDTAKDRKSAALAALSTIEEPGTPSEQTHDVHSADNAAGSNYQHGMEEGQKSKSHELIAKESSRKLKQDGDKHTGSLDLPTKGKGEPSQSDNEGKKSEGKYHRSLDQIKPDEKPHESSKSLKDGDSKDKGSLKDAHGKSESRKSSKKSLTDEINEPKDHKRRSKESKKSGKDSKDSVKASKSSVKKNKESVTRTKSSSSDSDSGSASSSEQSGSKVSKSETNTDSESKQSQGSSSSTSEPSESSTSSTSTTTRTTSESDSKSKESKNSKSSNSSSENLTRTSSSSTENKSSDSLNSTATSKSSSNTSGSASGSTSSASTAKPSKHKPAPSLSSTSNSTQQSSTSTILTSSELDLFAKPSVTTDSDTSTSSKKSSTSKKSSSASGSEKSVSSRNDDNHHRDEDAIFSPPVLSQSSASERDFSEESDSSSAAENTPPHTLTLRIDKVLFKTASPKTLRLLQNVHQFFVSFEFLNVPAQELETGSCKRNASGSHQLAFKKTFPLHPFKNEQNRHTLTRMLNARNSRDSCILFTVVSEPTEDSDPDAECEDIAFARLDLIEVAETGSDSVHKELQIWDSNGDILMGTLHVHIKGCSVLAECLE
ncbi:X-linked retinitis pigmentosa GTPase regulator-interacting protein 1 [Chytriomyces hyalinus]|nr:X-linked retinitis pigmentosa GTPase regulator-interacting protein 1 [Chytriomyces hyalinus]